MSIRLAREYAWLARRTLAVPGADLLWSALWAAAGGGVAPGSRCAAMLAELRRTCVSGPDPRQE